MDNLKCNILTCRTILPDKAVVTTCSHIFCVECANALFNNSRLCPACETSLTEPDDVVVCSLQPSNDYKTSVLSGLNPGTIVEICSRALSFWQYQVHQEYSFQQTVLRNINDKYTNLQKELDSAVREARGQINLLNNKVAELERDMELERRKSVTVQDSLKDRDKEYQRLKAQYDRLRRKALLAPGNSGAGTDGPIGNQALSERRGLGLPSVSRNNGSAAVQARVDVNAAVGGMEASGIQRTPIAVRINHQPPGSTQVPQQARRGFRPQREPFNCANPNRSFTSVTVSDHSENEVENLLGGLQLSRNNTRNSDTGNSGWEAHPSAHQVRNNFKAPMFAGQPFKKSGVFRPARLPGQ